MRNCNILTLINKRILIRDNYWRIIGTYVGKYEGIIKEHNCYGFKWRDKIGIKLRHVMTLYKTKPYITYLIFSFSTSQ
jgi:hypothetical protein